MGAEAYIRFERVGGEMPFVTTEKWLVVNLRADWPIGTIKWCSPWRRYAFFPEDATIWDVACLALVTEKIETLMRIRRNVRVNQGKARP